MSLAERWPLEGGGDLRDELLAAWGSGERGYHDLRHLAEVLDRLADLGCSDSRVLLAAWFHDAVYDGRPEAEERSARWAEDALPSLGLSAEEVAEVARLVRLTEDHRPAPGDASGEALTDADLAILAADDARYAEYVAGVRAEYAHVPEPDFAAGRAAVLSDLLAKETLFHTAVARERWEERARENLARELADLADRRTPFSPPIRTTWGAPDGR